MTNLFGWNRLMRAGSVQTFGHVAVPAKELQVVPFPLSGDFAMNFLTYKHSPSCCSLDTTIAIDVVEGEELRLSFSATHALPSIQRESGRAETGKVLALQFPHVLRMFFLPFRATRSAKIAIQFVRRGGSRTTERAYPLCLPRFALLRKAFSNRRLVACKTRFASGSLRCCGSSSAVRANTGGFTELVLRRLCHSPAPTDCSYCNSNWGKGLLQVAGGLC